MGEVHLGVECSQKISIGPCIVRRMGQSQPSDALRAFCGMSAEMILEGRVICLKGLERARDTSCIHGCVSCRSGHADFQDCSKVACHSFGLA
jgi:hypothetical protein